MLSTKRIRTFYCVHCGSVVATLWEKGTHYEIKRQAEWVETERMYRCPSCGRLTPGGPAKSEAEKSGEG